MGKSMIMTIYSSSEVPIKVSPMTFAGKEIIKHTWRATEIKKNEKTMFWHWRLRNFKDFKKIN